MNDENIETLKKDIADVKTSLDKINELKKSIEQINELITPKNQTDLLSNSIEQIKMDLKQQAVHRQRFYLLLVLSCLSLVALWIHSFCYAESLVNLPCLSNAKAAVLIVTILSWAGLVALLLFLMARAGERDD